MEVVVVFDGQIRDHGMFNPNFVLSDVFPQMMPIEMLVGRWFFTIFLFH